MLHVDSVIYLLGRRRTGGVGRVSKRPQCWCTWTRCTRRGCREACGGWSWCTPAPARSCPRRGETWRWRHWRSRWPGRPARPAGACGREPGHGPAPPGPGEWRKTPRWRRRASPGTSPRGHSSGARAGSPTQGCDKWDPSPNMMRFARPVNTTWYWAPPAKIQDWDFICSAESCW